MAESPSSSPALDRLVARAARLYSLPGVAIRVLELTNNPAVDARALKECIENDPALTTKILRVVNSSLFGLSGEVSDLNQALALLGTKPLKLLVLGFSLPEGLFADLAADVLGRYWRRTLTKSVAAREISRTLFRREGDEAFIAALLQDLGMLVLVQQLGEPYVTFLERVRAEGGDLPTLEAASLGFDHVELSARLLDQWGLPPVLIAAVAASHAEARFAALAPRERTLAQIVRLAELLAVVLTDGRADELPELLRVGKEYCGLSSEQLDALVATLGATVEQLADVLSLTLSKGQDFRDVLAAAHAQLADVAADVLADVVRAERSRNAAFDADDALLAQTQSLAAAVARFAATGRDADIMEEVEAAPAAPTRTSTTSVATVVASPRSARNVAGDMLGSAASAQMDPDLEGHVAAAVAACRQSRVSLSLLVVELDRYDELAFARGPRTAAKYAELVHAMCRAVDHPQAECIWSGDAQGALILPDCDRLQAVQVANELLGNVRRLGERQAGVTGPRLSISVGVATVSSLPRNFPAANLIASADRCLYGAKSSGGNGAKSIEIY